jgi:hypothetical protein
MFILVLVMHHANQEKLCMLGFFLLVHLMTSQIQCGIYQEEAPYMEIRYFFHLGRGELHGILALSIVADLFKKHYSSNAPVGMICDNQGVTSKCNNMSITSLRSHRSPNIDLYITQQRITLQNKISPEWIKGHSDKAPWESIQI